MSVTVATDAADDVAIGDNAVGGNGAMVGQVVTIEDNLVFTVGSIHNETELVVSLNVIVQTGVDVLDVLTDGQTGGNGAHGELDGHVGFVARTLHVEHGQSVNLGHASVVLVLEHLSQLFREGRGLSALNGQFFTLLTIKIIAIGDVVVRRVLDGGANLSRILNGSGQGLEVDRAVCQSVGTTHIQNQLAIDEDPHVVVTGEGELHGSLRSVSGNNLTILTNSKVDGELHAETVVGGITGLTGLIQGEETSVVVVVLRKAAGFHRISLGRGIVVIVIDVDSSILRRVVGVSGNAGIGIVGSLEGELQVRVVSHQSLAIGIIRGLPGLDRGLVEVKQLLTGHRVDQLTVLIQLAANKALHHSIQGVRQCHVGAGVPVIQANLIAIPVVLILINIAECLIGSTVTATDEQQVTKVQRIAILGIAFRIHSIRRNDMVQIGEHRVTCVLNHPVALVVARITIDVSEINAAVVEVVHNVSVDIVIVLFLTATTIGAPGAGTNLVARIPSRDGIQIRTISRHSQVIRLMSVVVAMEQNICCISRNFSGIDTIANLCHRNIAIGRSAPVVNHVGSAINSPHIGIQV